MALKLPNLFRIANEAKAGKASESKAALAPKEKSVFQIDFSQKIFDLPELKDRTKIDLRYPLLPPYAYVHVFWDKENQELMYVVEEPILTELEKEVLRLVQLGLEEMINISYVKAAKANIVIDYLEKNVRSIMAELGVKVSEETYKKVMYYIYRDSVGLNEIEPILNDYYVEDIECNGSGFYVYVVHRKFQNLRTNIIYNEKQKLANFVEKLAQKSGRYVSYAKPLLDGTLPDGSRVNATYTEDVTTRGPTYTIRKFTKEPWTPIHLIDSKTAPAELFAYLWLTVEYKFNIMMIGETGSGKTTFLNTIMDFIPPEARIVSIEDTRELNLVHENWLPAVTRTGFGMPNLIGQQYGEINLFDLLKESFRQNPDYVILGETRGQEASVLFQGMASGHPSYSTFHAASVETLVRRLSSPPIDLPPSLVESLDVVGVITHVKTADENVRRLKHTQEIIRVQENNKVIANASFEWNPATDEVEFKGKSVILERIQERLGIEMGAILEELDLRTKLLKKMHENRIFGFKEVGTIINAYYKDRDALLQKFGIPTIGGIKGAKRIITKPTAVSFMDWNKNVEGGGNLNTSSSGADTKTSPSAINSAGFSEISFGKNKQMPESTAPMSTNQPITTVAPILTNQQMQSINTTAQFNTGNPFQRQINISMAERNVSAQDKAQSMEAVEKILGDELIKKLKTEVRKEIKSEGQKYQSTFKQASTNITTRKSTTGKSKKAGKTQKNKKK